LEKEINVMKILFVYDHQYEDTWKDGLYAAIELLSQKHDITKCNIAKEPIINNMKDFADYDFVLGWGAFGSPVDVALQLFQDLSTTTARVGLCVAGNAFPMKTQKYDVLYYETEWAKEWILKTAENLVPPLIHAFGYNSKIYTKETDYDEPMLWSYMTVGAFANWKRQEKLLSKTGDKLAIGEIQKDNLPESMAIIGPLLMNGVMVSNMVSPWTLAKFYHQANIVYLPADLFGGGERAVIEAKACGTVVQVEDDNPKLQELLKSDTLKWTEQYYADQLESGFKKQ